MIARAKQKPPARCIVPACNRDCDAPRGLCTSCYQSGRKLIHSGQTTWEQLEQLGLSRPQVTAESANPLRRAFAAYVAAKSAVKSAAKPVKQKSK